MKYKKKYNPIYIMILISGFGMISKDPEVLAYIKTLNVQQRKTLEIAQDHLESSFNIYKSIGFLKWKDTQKK